ncbi:hypothetical protein PACTADRAFT_33592 [Pachysolen tannophilus NRRL Y-2460]|uniref:Survival protein SurE-like phosphatase/nucleotidase domain-containing protein n=1 Tax=Pachysolen tannophilus NRRL Y-2460 TaxID=669874 RepID=A0A1E4TXD5_PACTA|nr:hypothetical protein PACTADRAFT_33592 [Pachysolen tannophilus NRRL Y-2460]
MKVASVFSSAIALLASTCYAKNIILTNDDGWASTNIRAAYNALTDAGHNVFLVAPASQRSGWGGRYELPDTTTLLTDGEFSYPPAGAPSFSYEPTNDHIWYLNGTPAACVGFALDYVIPRYFPNITIDLVVAGPNEGTNIGSGAYTYSGTIAATYNAVLRGYPGIAFSGSMTNNSFFKDSLNNDTDNPSNILGQKVVQLADVLFTKQGVNSRTLPLSIGLNVNFPNVGTDSSTNCTDPKYVFTRFTGSKETSTFVTYDNATGLLGTTSKYTAPDGNCLNGNCSLTSGTALLASGCYASIDVFSIDYDAPIGIAYETENLFAAALG